MLVVACTQEIDSTPPATMIGTRSTITRWAAIAIVCSPDEQKRLTVAPPVLIARPARSAAWRAMLLPVAPSGIAQPSSTSSTSPGSTPARSTAALITWPASVAPWVMLKPPRQDLASPVRAVDTITASAICLSQSQPLNVLPSAARRASSGAGCQNAASAWGFAANPRIDRATSSRPTMSA